MSIVTNFEMANSDDPVEIIKATQRSVVAAIKGVVAETKAACGGPGLTWPQIEFLLSEFEKKEPKIIFQEDPV